MALLDTAAIIDLTRRPAASTRRRAWKTIRARVESGEALVTSRFNVAELYVGIELARDPVGESAKIKFILRWIQVLEFDDRSAEVFARLFAILRSRGRTPADLDLLIASVAMANGHSIVTRNVRHFNSIPGLIVHSY